MDHSDPTQPQTHSHPPSPDDGPNGPQVRGQTHDHEDYSNYVNPIDCCRKHDRDLTALLSEIEALELQIRMNESDINGFDADFKVIDEKLDALDGRIGENETDLTELDTGSGTNEGKI